MSTIPMSQSAATLPLTLDDLEIVALSDSQWRVRDGRLPESDVSGLLAFIERTTRTDPVFELMALSSGFEWFLFPSLSDALAYLVDHVVSTTRQERPPTAVHAPAGRPV